MKRERYSEERTLLMLKEHEADASIWDLFKCWDRTRGQSARCPDPILRPSVRVARLFAKTKENHQEEVDHSNGKNHFQPSRHSRTNSTYRPPRDSGALFH